MCARALNLPLCVTRESVNRSVARRNISGTAPPWWYRKTSTRRKCSTGRSLWHWLSPGSWCICAWSRVSHPRARYGRLLKLKIELLNVKLWNKFRKVINSAHLIALISSGRVRNRYVSVHRFDHLLLPRCDIDGHVGRSAASLHAESALPFTSQFTLLNMK